MEELKSLQGLTADLRNRFATYKGEDFTLPQGFKSSVKAVSNHELTYNEHTVIVATDEGAKGTHYLCLPNQLFFLAACCSELYNELIKYKEAALSVTTKARLRGLNGKPLSEQEQKAVQGLGLNRTSQRNLSRFLTDYAWWGGGKSIDKADFYVSPILSLTRTVEIPHAFFTDLCSFLADNEGLAKSVIEAALCACEPQREKAESLPLQQIIYGAPGSGKSFKIKQATEGESVIRTTFHPDSDYATFVGCHKPTTQTIERYTARGSKAIPLKDSNGNILTEERVVYKFVEQAFMQAYEKAWKYYAEAKGGEQAKRQFLVIEEINRGNCAQIFGDLFQLLDRNKYGFSDYSIQADSDMSKRLREAFDGLHIPQAERIDRCCGAETTEKVLSGEILLLPDNLYIWATMNTSDQSLFPIDSAFKRRWDWQYIPISRGLDSAGNELSWMIDVDGELYDWWDFLSVINTHIYDITNSEDKQLGFFFCIAKDGIISAETFVSKVVFYLWNDVFKDFGFDDSIFTYTEASSSHKLSFDKFCTATGGVNVETVRKFLANIGLSPLEIKEEDEDTEETSGQSGHDNSLFSINGKGKYPKGHIGVEVMKLYVANNPDLTVDEVITDWKQIGSGVHRLVQTKEEYEDYVKTSIVDEKKTRSRFVPVELPKGGVVYVSNQFELPSLKKFISRLRQLNWPYVIEKVSE